jgi:GT2 family glycosyltransferase
VREVVVFDNGSAHPLVFRHPKVRLLAEGRNLGFAAAVNRAFGQLTADYVLLLNPDLRIDARSVRKLVDAAERYRCPIVGPRFFWDDGRHFRLPPATGALRWLDVGAADPDSVEGQLRSFFWADYHDAFWAAETPFRQPFLSGACLLLARPWLMQLGRVFDERFFLYYEDTDLCLEAQRRGLLPLCVPAAEAVHYWDQSPDAHDSKAEMMRAAHSELRLKYQLRSDALGPWSPLLTEVPSPPFHDLGVCEQSPRFAPQCFPLGSRFEVAVGPGFVPFAQTVVGARGLLPIIQKKVLPLFCRAHAHRCRGFGTRVFAIRLPEAVWTRLRPGRYYARARMPDGTVHARWQWTRSP